MWHTGVSFLNAFLASALQFAALHPVATAIFLTVLATLTVLLWRELIVEESRSRRPQEPMPIRLRLR